MSDITIFLGMNADAAFRTVAEVKAKIDEMTEKAKIARALVIQQIREGFFLISTLMSSMRQAMTLFGQQIDPFFSALVGMVLSTTSMLISSATALSATVIGIPVGAILFGVAISFNILTIGKLIADKEKTDGILTSLSQAIASGAGATRQAPGGLGGF